MSFLFWVQELAQVANDTETVEKMTKQLEELEERAEELDRQRTKGLSAIRLPGLPEQGLYARS